MTGPKKSNGIKAHLARQDRKIEHITHLLEDITQILGGMNVTLAHIGIRLDTLDHKPPNEELMAIIRRGTPRR